MTKPISKGSLAARALALVVVLVCETVLAQNESERTELRRSGLAGTQNTEVIMSELKLPPGAGIPRHFHHGEEYLYVIRGGTVETPDKKVITFEPGQTLHFERDEIHGGFVATGNSVLKVVTVHIVDKDKPLYARLE